MKLTSAPLTRLAAGPLNQLVLANRKPTAQAGTHAPNARSL